MVLRKTATSPPGRFAVTRQLLWGGHRVPFIAAWPAGGVGDGRADTPGQSNDSIIGLTDMYATFAEMAGAALPDLRLRRQGGG